MATKSDSLRWANYVWRLLRRTAQAPAWCYLAPLILTIVLCGLPTVFSGIPVPKIDDEWGYLLGADTFVSGRLTNPAPDHPAHFEARHQVVQPTRFTKYPPGQSSALALGQLIIHPILGVWLGCMLMVVSCVWMLRAWMPAPWALLGGILTACQFVAQGMPWSNGLPGYWSQSYWGGALAAAGGALLYGALLRLRSRPLVHHGFILAFGLALLATTRPKEGVLVALPAAVLLLFWLVQQRGPAFRQAMVRIVAPTVLGLAALLAFTGHYNKTLTGDTLKMPWSAHYDQYVVFPLFIWGETRTNVTWENPDLEAFYNGWERELHERHHTLKGAAEAIVSKIGRFLAFYLGPVLALCLILFARPLLRRRGMKMAACIGGLMLLNTAASFAAFPHYAAPWTAICTAITLGALRHLRVVRRETGLGRRLLCFALLALGVLTTGAVVRSTQRVASERGAPRIRLQRDLEAKEGKHLVLVRYGTDYIAKGGAEYIFNPADLDAAKVLWARDLDPARNAAMLQDFPDRLVWRLHVERGTRPELQSVQ